MRTLGKLVLPAMALLGVIFIFGGMGGPGPHGGSIVIAGSILLGSAVIAGSRTK